MGLGPRKFQFQHGAWSPTVLNLRYSPDDVAGLRNLSSAPLITED